MSAHPVGKTNLIANTYHEFKHACTQFKHLSIQNKVMTVALSVIASIATFFLLGVGGVFTFNALVKVLTPSVKESGKSEQQHHHQDVSWSTFFNNFKEAEKALFEKGIQRWLDDDTVTGEKQTAAARIRHAYDGKEQELDLSYLDLSSVPPEIWSVSSLRTLSLENNKFLELPKEIKKLRLLSSLNLSSNLIESLPCEIGQLEELRLLNLNRNRLTTLPPQIGCLVSLNELILSGNSLRVLPDEMGNLMALTTLNLEYNLQLERLPETMDRLPRPLKIFKNNTLIPGER